MTRRHPSRYEQLANIQELARALRNMIRTGLASKPTLKPVAAVCRPAACAPLASVADLSCRAFAHMVGTFRGEQVLILAVGGELDTAFVLRGFIPAITPRRLRRRMPCISFP